MKVLYYVLKAVGYVLKFPGEALYNFSVKKLTPTVTAAAVAAITFNKAPVVTAGVAVTPPTP